MTNLELWRPHIKQVCTFYRYHYVYPENVLDIGFGESSTLIKNGFMYPHAKLMDYIEPHPDYLKELFPNGEVTGLDYQLDISQTFLQEECDKYYGKFDLIFAIDVLEHVKKPWIAATNLLNMLTEDGHLFLSAPSIGIEHHPSKFGRYPDLWRFFEGSFEQLFERQNIGKLYEEVFLHNGEMIGVIGIFQKGKSE